MQDAICIINMVSGFHFNTLSLGVYLYLLLAQKEVNGVGKGCHSTDGEPHIQSTNTNVQYKVHVNICISTLCLLCLEMR